MNEPAPSHTEFSFVDTHGVRITVYEWSVENPIGVVQIAHGVGEHARRYGSFANRLNQAGFTVLANDHRGHGRTGLTQHNGDHALLGKLGDGGLSGAQAAVLQLAQSTRKRFPGIPLFAFAHSWGSIMVQRLMNQGGRLWDGVILSGSAYRTPRYMRISNLNAPWAGPDASGLEWLSRDEHVVARFVADPLCFDADVLKLFGLRDALRLFGTPTRHVASDVSILIASGGADTLNKDGGLARLELAYLRRGVRDVSVKVYPEARHEIIGEINREEVFGDLIAWLRQRADAPQP